MVVVGGEEVVGEVLVRIAGAPFRVLRFLTSVIAPEVGGTMFVPSSEYADGC